MNRRAQAFLGELDHELRTTRSLLAIVPEAQAEWKPHPKSMTLGALAAHVAGLVDWGVVTIERSEFDVDPPEGERYVPTKFESASKLVEEYDAKVEKLKALLADCTDEQMSEPWSLKYQGHIKFTMPRVNTLRMFVVNHMIHHRGQLSVYLRMNDVPLPSIYGPTADNPM